MSEFVYNVYKYFDYFFFVFFRLCGSFFKIGADSFNHFRWPQAIVRMLICCFLSKGKTQDVEAPCIVCNHEYRVRGTSDTG